jgi:hypothetical protein
LIYIIEYRKRLEKTKNIKTIIISMKIPKSYFDISIRQFDELKRANEIEDQRERQLAQLAILLDIDIDEVEKLPITKFQEINESIKFLLETPKGDFRRIIEIDGIKWGFVRNLEHITLGEWIDLDYYVAEWDDAKHKLASVLWRRVVSEDELGYEIEEYDGSKAEEASKIFYDKLSYGDIWMASVFFCHIAGELLIYSKGSLLLSK